ncbi:MAG: ABC transporter permease DevC [Puniceicoccales bacterium]|jgi:putative ABC transport system permease protein|nr:ABC transporter permease DevC [Puniceicoccales bacterium]
MTPPPLSASPDPQPASSARRPFLERLLPLGIPLAWLQLVAERKRFAAAVAGIMVAVTLMLFLMGLKTALFKQALAPFHKLRADIYVVSPQYEYIGLPRLVSTATLRRALALPEVESADPLWMTPLPLKNPETGRARDLFVMAFEPEDRVFADAGIEAGRHLLGAGNTALMDALAHPEFGRFAELLKESPDGTVHAELNDTGIDVVGLCSIGTTFIADGNLVTSRDAFLRAFPGMTPERAMLGVIRLRAGADPAAVAARLNELLPADARALTAAEALERETGYWSDRTPIGFVINATMLVALVVGAIIVFQILYTDVSDHLPEYATLKSIGFSDGYFTRLVLQESLILSVCGFVPGVALAFGACRAAWDIAGLPAGLRAENLALVFALTLGMCLAAGALATRKLRRADPAEIV